MVQNDDMRLKRLSNASDDKFFWVFFTKFLNIVSSVVYLVVFF